MIFQKTNMIMNDLLNECQSYLFHMTSCKSEGIARNALTSVVRKWTFAGGGVLLA